MLSFSPNMLKTFNECPKKFDFKYIQKISIPQKSSFFEKGKKVHALANYYLRGDDISKIEQNLNAEEKAVWEKLKANEYFNKKYVNSEYNLSAQIDKYWIGGRLDALMQGNENYFILDYKTGRIPYNAQEDFQTMVYLLCADKKLKLYDSLQFIYIDLKNNENFVIEFNNEVKKLYEEKIAETCKRITEAHSLPKFDGKRCEFCEYKKICI